MRGSHVGSGNHLSRDNICQSLADITITKKKSIRNENRKNLQIGIVFDK
jgi:hypothetical protein